MAGLESLLKGRELGGRYRIEEVIGRGGMGAVYRATDTRLGRPVAVKVITASTGNDPEVRERLRARFKHEAASAARLPKHPNAVTVHDYGTDDDLGLDYIVMELLEGEDLATRLQRAGPPPMGEALRVLREAARGVHVGHRTHLIHRDVKPGNVFLVRGGGEDEVRVLDFGIAKAMAEEEEDTASAGLTHDGRAPLSPAYASPEQLRGERRLTPASDVFSLGALGFQLLTGTRPFTEADRNRMAAGMEVPVPSLRARNPQVPQEVETVIRRALAPDPGERFENAGALADALDPLLRRLSASPVMGVVPGVTGAMEVDDDDRTMAAGSPAYVDYADDDDRTMVAPPVPAVRPTPPVHRGPPPAQRAQNPVMPPPRHRVLAEERRGVPAYVWVLLLVVVALGAWVVMQQMNARRSTGPVAGDSVTVDTARQDTIDSVDALVLNTNGLRFFNAGQYDSALVYFERAVQQQPRSAEYRDNLGATLIRMGRHQDAAALLEETIRIDNRYDLLYSHLAEARLALGDTVSAVRALEAFVEVTLSANERRSALARLEQLRAAVAPPPIQPVPGPTDVNTPSVPGPDGPVDTLSIPARPNAPRDTLRIGNPR
ncbi:protein kinase domain-containing protein [Longimicrobium sp.]|uniref:serine/threonine-protein kinase n=1 Tax=Longimicrobium sp. TaxID=2029185 RepID=UPI002E308E45|nr:protein kinase [Longimicrobium sp.]HEX6038273.1 protein kinase [Longimicrobium sp.]